VTDESAPSADAGDAGAGAGGSPRVPALSFFFPAHNEAENIEALVDEALAALPALAGQFEIIAVDDGSRDATPAIADRLAAEHAGVIRAVHHDVNRGYGAALRSGFGAAQFPLVGFTDGDRQFRVADLRLLLERLEAPDRPDAVVGYRLRRADSRLRLAYARAYRASLRLFFGLAVHDVDCACKVFRRDALADVRVESGGAFLSAELLIKLVARGGKVVEVGVPHYPRLAGRASGANPRVVGRAVRDFWFLRLRLWANPRRALARGTRVLGDAGREVAGQESAGREPAG
jgi:glycosyltransferase involved in cell wall biosynthesis